MKPKRAYTHWSEQYDTNFNKTRDLEAIALRKELSGRTFQHCLELGCGTGKNTLFLAELAKAVTAVDLTDAMLQKAKEKVKDTHVRFVKADLLQPWDFAKDQYNLITFSLVLEHIEYMQPIMEKAVAVLRPGGLIYIGELHPFKQYRGSKARFETAYGMQEVECYNHHVSDFVNAAIAAGLHIDKLNEYFDTDDRKQLPRVLTLLLRKP